MTDYRWQAAAYAEELCGLLAEPENVEAIDGIFEADLVRSQSFEVIGQDKNVIVLRDASGFDVLLTVTCEEITEERTAAVDAARLAREEADDETPGEIIDLHSR
jgi:enhancing lycopene biosynthesis protein 2